MKRLMLASAVGICLALLSASYAQDKRPMTFDDVMTLKNVGGVNISPDGKAVLYTLSYADLKENESQSEIWIVTTSGGKPRRFTSGKNDRAPQWSPDGQWIAFISGRGSTTPPASGPSVAPR